MLNFHFTQLKKISNQTKGYFWSTYSLLLPAMTGNFVSTCSGLVIIYVARQSLVTPKGVVY